MNYPSDDIATLFEQASIHDEQGDVYNAVKLYKRIIRLAPDWQPPYARLGQLYKLRQDWKAALHYNKKAVALHTLDRHAWWNVGIAATALRKQRLANNVWSKFGLENARLPHRLCVRVQYARQFELIWARPIDPARAVIESIPAPVSDRRFQDIILTDGTIAGYNVVRNQRFPVYDELGVLKRSVFHTFSCWVEVPVRQDLMLLSKLCQEAGLGMENWSNATNVLAAQIQKNLPEYYGQDGLRSSAGRMLHIAIAAPGRQEATEVLQTWAAICIGSYTELILHL